MASISEYYNQLISEKETFQQLNNLTPVPDGATVLAQDVSSGSKVALWRLMLWISAYCAWIIDQLTIQHKSEMLALKQRLITGTAQWYQEQCFRFQYGHDLVWNDSIYDYQTADENSKIIKRAAVKSNGSVVSIKVAKLINEVPSPLSTAEKTSFEEYISQIQFAGININIITAAADLMKLDLKVYYDPLVMSPDGSLILNSALFPVEEALSSFLGELPFNGVLNLTKLVDAIQAAEGVIDPILNSAEAKYGNLSYIEIEENYTSYAGYMKIDPNIPLSTQIQYVSN